VAAGTALATQVGGALDDLNTVLAAAQTIAAG
jgi:hypothetical protein